jgi:hypothetical protein
MHAEVVAHSIDGARLIDNDLLETLPQAVQIERREEERSLIETKPVIPLEAARDLPEALRPRRAALSRFGPNLVRCA